MIRYCFGMLIFSFSFCVAGVSDKTEELNEEAINDALFCLYVELKCPPSHHFKETSYPYIYCIRSIKYVDAKVFFRFDVFGDYKKYIKSNRNDDKEGDLREVMKLVAWDVGIPYNFKDDGPYGLKDFGAIHSVALSNIASSHNLVLESESVKAMRKWIKNNSILYLVHVDSPTWYQLALDSDKKLHYSAAIRPKTIPELLKARAKSGGI